MFNFIKLTTTIKLIALNTIFQIIGKIFSLSITIFTTIIVTRFYGVEGYGAFSLMQNWPALFFIITDFGINAIATKELSKDFSKANLMIFNIFLFRILISLFFIFCLFFALLLFGYDDQLLFGLRLGLFIILTHSLFTTTNIIFQVKLKYYYSSIGYILGYIVIFILVLILSLQKINIAWVNFCYVIGGIVTFLTNLYFLKKLKVNLNYSIDLKIIKDLFVKSYPLGIMFVFSQINFRSDSILLSFLPLPKDFGLTNTQSVAIYSLPYKIFDVALVIPTFFMNSVYPVLVQHMNISKNKLKETLFKSIKFLIFISVISSIVLILCAPLAIYVLGGTEFKNSIFVLQILLSGLMLYYLTQPLSWLIVTLDKQKYLPFIYFVGTLVNLVLNFTFIPIYSFYASSFITHISEFVILLLLIIFAQKSWKSKYEST